MVLQVVDFRCAEQYIFDGVNIALQNIDGFTGCDFGCAEQYIWMVIILRYKNIDGFTGSRFRVCGV